MLVSGVIVENGVHPRALRHGALDSVKKADEFLMGVALHAAAVHDAIEGVEGGEQGGGAPRFREGRLCRLYSCVMVPHLPDFIGSPGWVRSSAWICDFSSIESTTAWAGGCM